MKQLTCEMCGSTNLIKQDGVFVCQTCGCKYSVEEAKRMMIEGTVDVSGSTIKVDNSAFVEKYLANARRAKEKEDWDEVEKYYNMVEQNDPDNIEAIFYSAYGKAKSTLVEDDIYKRQAAFKVLSNCISVIDDHYKKDRVEENKEAIVSMGIDLAKMITSNFVYKEWKNGYGIVTKSTQGDTYTLFANLVSQFKESIDNIQKIDDQPYLHETLITLLTVTKALPPLYFNQNVLSAWLKEEKRELAVLVWKNQNPEQFAQLEQEKAELEKRLVDYKEQYNQSVEVAKVNELKNTVAEKKAELGKLSGFESMGKKGKTIKAEINQANYALKDAERACSALKKKLDEESAKVQIKLNEVNDKLATPPKTE